MGSDKNRMDPTSYEKWEKKKELWAKITDGGLVSYLKRLHGNDPKMIEDFMNGWKKGILMSFGVEFRINEAFITKITGLQMDDKNFYRERKAAKEATSSFFNKQSERNRVRKMANGGYRRKDLQPLWVDVAEVIIRYLHLTTTMQVSSLTTL